MPKATHRINDSWPVGGHRFHGGTLSPLLCLIAFNPVIQSVATHPSKGFSFNLHADGAEEGSAYTVPCKGSHVYALWEKEDFAEAPGWYLAKVASVDDQGTAKLKFRRDGLTNLILGMIKWKCAKGNGKWYSPPSRDPRQ